MIPAPAIELRGVTKDFAVGLRGVKLRALDGVSLRIPEGEVFGLLGPNGSGKSTAIKIILGLLTPTVGQSAVFGRSSQRIETRRLIGYLPESPDFYRYLTGRELVRFYAELCGLERTGLSRRIADVIAWVGLTAAADRRVGTYSKGMLQRIGLAQALVHDPRLLILDEPTAGVDPVASAAITELILTLKAEGKTILITSHLLAQIEDVCDRVAILDQGRLALEGRVNDLVGAAAGDHAAVVVEKLSMADVEELRQWLLARGGSLAKAVSPRARLDRIFVDHVRTNRSHDPR